MNIQWKFGENEKFSYRLVMEMTYILKFVQIRVVLVFEKYIKTSEIIK